MRKAFIIAALLLNSISLFPESYKVVKVIGNIVVKKSGAQLSQGDVIQASEPIIFKTPESKASVISSEKGRFVLAANSVNNSSSLKSNLIPPMSNISSRGVAMFSVGDIKNNFFGKYLLLQRSEENIPGGILPLNDSSFFFFTFTHNAEEINKKIGHNGNTLIITEKDLFMVDGKAVAHAESTFVKVNYYSNKKPLFLNEMSVITPNNDQIKKEINMILNESKTKTYDEKVKDITSYLNEFYGKIDDDNVKVWLKENLGLTK